MDHKRSIKNDKIFLRHYLKQFGDKYLDEITREDIIDAVAIVKATNATKNRYLCLLRTLLRKAEREWNWIEKAPFIKTLPEPKRRIRWLTVEEVQRLLEELPTHQNQFVRFALATGLRQGNVLGMTWDRVDLLRRTCWVEAEDFKTDKAHGVPLNDAALAVIYEVIEKHPTHLFTYRGGPIKQANTKAWRSALKRAGIKNFRWHDLRHVSASWLIQAGTPSPVVQDFFGWESPAMVQRYAHLAPEHLAPFAAKLDGKLMPHPKKIAT
ncbi:tyrosine-type recombinase/integrase [Chitinimonas sp. BJB300]|uniref:tyrosine-type recombinase/integrase n=1 Tax=Chitinimonas sp. BJB300 TaxID=1559339 RepID=UPI000C11D4DE|nr:site-specific integrase [Chitinimonas sp. BJB300]PHV09729.1 integrase [Chitinimonas sp. BJB300]TSJ88109.1 tyrosine-type recombinase/integrase [Chitinimonas sp. BJB300]